MKNTLASLFVLGSSLCSLAVAAGESTSPTYRIQYKVAHTDNHQQTVAIEPSVTIRAGQTVTMSVADHGTTYDFDVKFDLVDGHPVAVSNIHIKHDDTSTLGGPRLVLLCDDPQAAEVQADFSGKAAHDLVFSAKAEAVKAGAQIRRAMTRLMQHPLEFNFAGHRVGYFVETEFPRVDGRYRYMPYRSVAHLQMCQAVRAGERPRCVMADGSGVSFAVVAKTEYGVLQLGEFETLRG